MTDNPYKRRIPRTDRRVMLVLLSDAANLSGYPIMRAAKIGSPYVVLARMERLGWVTSEWEERGDGEPRRRFYRLTPEGRVRAMGLLGLQERR